MDSKNAEALTYGREYMLAKFANLPLVGTPAPPMRLSRDGNASEAKASLVNFVGRFGELCPGLTELGTSNYVLLFRHHWGWKGRDETARRQRRRRTHSLSLDMQGSGEKADFERDDASAFVTNILNRRHGNAKAGSPVALECEFSTGHIRVVPETLLDWLVLSLMECRERLAHCERKACLTPYFVKMHPRQRYCSESCFRDSRLDKKNRWWKENRGGNAKRLTGKSTKPTKRGWR